MGESAAPRVALPCPVWCVTAHDPARGEEDWLHLSEPVFLANEVSAQLCMSIDPVTGERDGPYVLIGDTQHTPEEAERLGLALSALAQARPDPAGAA